MITTKKDAATIRAVIQRLRTAPKPKLTIYCGLPMAAEDAAQRQYIDWACSYVIGDLLALLPEDEKPKPVKPL